MQKRMLMIFNAHAGTMKLKNYFMQVVDLFCEHNIDVTVYSTKIKGDATRVVKQRAKEFDLLVCCGGDGTLNEVVTGMMQIKDSPPIGYIPAGTTNDFAASMQIPLNILQAAKQIVCGTEYKLDVGAFNTRHFCYVASFGAFTESSYSAPQKMKNTLGHLAYVLEGVKDLSNIRPYKLRIETPKETWEGEYLFGSVSNSTSLGGVLKLNPNEVQMDDGLFEVLLIKAPKTPAEMQKIINGLLTQQYDGEIISFFSTPAITFYPTPIIPWALDGEYEKGAEEVRIRNLQQAIRLIK